MSAITLVPLSSEKSQDVISISDSISMLNDEATNAFDNDGPEPNDIITKPLFLRSNNTKSDMIIDVDGSVRAGTVSALVEHLTSHESSVLDTTFFTTFLMMYKSFTTLDEFFNELVRRFFIQTPDGLSPTDVEEWKQLKQYAIQIGVLNTFRTMVMDEDFFEKEDLYILGRMKEFLQNEEVGKILAAKQLLSLVERVRVVDIRDLPPKNTKLNLFDIDPLELAQQLTIMESHLYQKTRPVEYLQRSRGGKPNQNDNIARVIQTSNRIAQWVADSVLSHEDSRKCAATLTQFISLADQCFSMQNYSSMVAIVSVLNSPAVRRLTYSWEQVNTLHMAQLGACEMIIDSGKNFNNYRSTLAEVSPPCVPFIGVSLMTLTLIQRGSEDTLPGNMVNFRKLQETSEVIQEIQRWQRFPYNFNPIPSVQNYLKESLAKFSEQD